MTLKITTPKGKTVAKKPTKKTPPKTETKTQAPLQRSEFGKTIHHYMIDHDQTLQDVAHGANVSLSTLRKVVNGSLTPPREWMANTGLPSFMREATALVHRERIAADYQLVRLYFPEFTMEFDRIADKDAADRTEIEAANEEGDGEEPGTIADHIEGGEES